MNKRQSDLLKALYKDRGFLTISKIAEDMGVSVKTVRNDISAIKDYLTQQGMGFLETKPHIGVRAVISEDEWARLREKDGGNDEETEIVFFIIRHLMKNGTLTAQRLSEQYYIGRNQLDKILGRVAKWFSENHILFDVRKGKGISISFSEFNYRMAQLNFYTEYAKHYAGLITLREAVYVPMSAEEYTCFCAALDGFDADSVAKIIIETEDKFGFKFNYMSGRDLLFLVVQSILRSRHGKEIEMPKVSPSAVDGISDEIIANDLIEGLNRGLNIRFSESEKEFIRFAVSISDIQEFATEGERHKYEIMNVELCRLTVRAVNIISDIADINLVEDSFFVHQMFLYFKTMVARLKYGLVIRNSLLPQIKLKYPNTMAIAWSLENMLEKELKFEINEHEVGFIALHIGGAIERKLSGISACIVCDYGIGVSQILKEKILRAIPELKITSVFSIRDIGRIKNEECDFIISTTPLDGYRLRREVLTVRHLFDGEDLRLIENHMVKIRKMRRIKVDSIAPTSALFKRDLIFPHCSFADKTELLKALCNKLEILGYITEEFEQSVMEREKITATDIGKGIAIPHGHNDYVNRSAVVFASLKKPIKWTADGEYTDLVFLLAFDRDESEETDKAIIKFYKSIVTFTEDDSVCEKLRTFTDSEQILKIFELW